MRHTALFILSLMFVLGCKKNDDTTVNTAANPIRFNNLQVGQKSRYLGLSGTNYFANNNGDFTYLDDTLTLEILAKDANGFLIKETFQYNPTSEVYPWLDYDRDSIYYYYLSVANDSVKAKQQDGPFLRSRIWNHHGAAGLPLSPLASPKIDIKGWKTGFPYCECINMGFTENYIQFGLYYARLNVMVQNSDMAFDGNGVTYVYSANNGLVRFATYGWWTQSGYGWDLLPQ
jgi:hypothetical protein